MSTLNDTRHKDNPRANDYHGILIFPFVACFLVASFPEGDITILIFAGLIFSGLVVWDVHAWIHKKYISVCWKVKFLIVNINVGAFFAIVAAWRYFGGTILLGAPMLLLYLICIVLCYKYRYKLGAALLAPGSKYSLVFYIILFAVMALGFGGSYGYSRLMVEIHGIEYVHNRFAYVLFPFGFLFTILMMSLWPLTEDPDYREKLYEQSKKNTH